MPGIAWRLGGALEVHDQTTVVVDPDEEALNDPAILEDRETHAVPQLVHWLEEYRSVRVATEWTHGPLQPPYVARGTAVVWVYS